MIPADREVILSSGEVITAGEVFEGLCRLAKNDSAFPLITDSDATKAVVATAFEALEYGREKEVL